MVMQAITVIKVMVEDDTKGLAKMGFSNACFVTGGSSCVGLVPHESALEVR
jgi:5,10-methylenetetrahydrofolate reductase